MWSIIAASVVVLPEPVGPVTSTRPRCSSASRRHDRRETELLHRRDAREHPPQHEPDRSALAEDVHPEAAEAGERVGEVGLVVIEELVGAGLRQERERDALGVGRRDRLAVPGLEVAVDPEVRRRADLDVDVGCLEPDGLTQQVVEIEQGRPLQDRGVCALGYRPARGVLKMTFRTEPGSARVRGAARGPRRPRRPWFRARRRCPAPRRSRAAGAPMSVGQARGDRVPERTEVVAALEERDQPAGLGPLGHPLADRRVVAGREPEPGERVGPVGVEARPRSAPRSARTRSTCGATTSSSARR